jgi:hypothetical protein
MHAVSAERSTSRSLGARLSYASNRTTTPRNSPSSAAANTVTDENAKPSHERSPTSKSLPGQAVAESLAALNALDPLSLIE